MLEKTTLMPTQAPAGTLTLEKVKSIMPRLSDAFESRMMVIGGAHSLIRGSSTTTHDLDTYALDGINGLDYESPRYNRILANKFTFKPSVGVYAPSMTVVIRLTDTVTRSDVDVFNPDAPARAGIKITRKLLESHKESKDIDGQTVLLPNPELAVQLEYQGMVTKMEPDFNMFFLIDLSKKKYGQRMFEILKKNYPKNDYAKRHKKSIEENVIDEDKDLFKGLLHQMGLRMFTTK